MKSTESQEGNQSVGAGHSQLTAAARRQLSGPALRTFFRIAEEWGLTDREQMKLLGLSDTRTARRWRRDGVTRLSRDTLERISYVLAIYERIHVLLPVARRAAAWMRAPNTAPIFAGQSALDRMTAGNVGDLYVVRQYLEAEVGGLLRESDLSS